MNQQNSYPKTYYDVTVVIPVYNGQNFVERATNSVLAQKEVTTEVIVIDDGSSDSSVEILKGFKDRIILKEQKNRGACAARNLGLFCASAPFVLFLDCDDFIVHPALKSHLDSLRTTGADCSFGPFYTASPHKNEKLKKRPRLESAETLLVDWLRGVFVGTTSVMWRTDSLRNLGGWNECLTKNQDGELIFRAVVSDMAFCEATKGKGVYWLHESTDRISQNFTLQKVNDCLTIYSWLIAALKEENSYTKEIDQSLSIATHGVERKCIIENFAEGAELVRQYRRKMSWPQYDGVLLHNIVSSLLGLKRKEHLAASLRRLQKKLL